MTDRLRIGIIGGGLIAQVEHLPNLLAARDRFVVAGCSEPSESLRRVLADRFAVPMLPDAEALLALPLDAVVIATPDPWHGTLACAAMEAGLHVFCEKPLCYGPAEIDAIAAVQRRTGRVLQVGYMKRFDPSYKAALALVTEKRDHLRAIAVEVSDPDAWPFVGHHGVVAAPTDETRTLAADTAERRLIQVEAALGFTPTGVEARGFAGPLCSALVHDVNAVHGLLDAMCVEPGAVLGAAIFAGGAGAQASIDLRDGQALWSLLYSEVPRLADYKERITLYFEDEIVDLAFPAPYLNHHPTRLTHLRSNGMRLDKTVVRPSYDAGFRTQFDHFWASVAGEVAPFNTLDDARRDQALLVAVARKVRDLRPGS